MRPIPVAGMLFEQGNAPLVAVNQVGPRTSAFQARHLKSQLAAVQWDFKNSTSRSAIEGLHPYPAKFIGEIPRALLEILPVPSGTVVLDPFCGSGTTLVECQRKGLPSVGIDLNPIACLMARVKTQPIADDLDSSISAVVLGAKSTSQPRIPQIPNLDHWFKPEVQHALAALTGAIAVAPETHREILRLAISSIVVRVSNQESDTRYAAINKDVTADQVFSSFSKAARRVGDVLGSRDYELSPAQVCEGDTLAFPATAVRHPVGIVITSPPYPNAYEYWLYHKYRMWWLGFDPLFVKDREIGARAHFFKGDRHTAEDFVQQMGKTFALLKQVVIMGGFVCFVVGRSRIHGELVDNAKIIDRVGVEAGFSPFYAKERILSPNRKSFNLSHANIKTETILVLRRNKS